MKIIAGLLFAIIIFTFLKFRQTTFVPTTSQPTPIVSTVTSNSKYAFPIDNFLKRITKKPFGIYITPQNSPIQPEKFTGYHTGADAEYSDVTGEAKVYAIADGKVIYSGWVSGYGGFIAIQHPDSISVYGHLNPASLLKSGVNVAKGQNIGILGDAYSHQTDGERKHLHFGIIKGSKLDFRGYVQNPSDLSLWINPITLFP
jgi:murein DD-endopeptidase MepM/ murein hydrolase activator NlpD